MLVLTVWGGSLLVPSEDLSIVPELLINGSIELPLTRYMIKNIKRENIVFDIGANIGYFTVLAGKLVGPGGKVIAFEPNPYLYRFLSDNVSLNCLHDRVTLNQKAVYSSSAKINFYMALKFMGNSSINCHDREYFKRFEDEIKEITVEAEPLDIYLKSFDHIDLVKMDIEGGEYQAFLGMKGLMEQKVVKTVVFELNKMMLKDDREPFIQNLKQMETKFNRSFFKLSDEGDLVPISVNDLAAMDFCADIVLKC